MAGMITVRSFRHDFEGNSNTPLLLQQQVMRAKIYCTEKLSKHIRWSIENCILHISSRVRDHYRIQPLGRYNAPQHLHQRHACGYFMSDENCSFGYNNECALYEPEDKRETRYDFMISSYYRFSFTKALRLIWQRKLREIPRHLF